VTVADAFWLGFAVGAIVGLLPAFGLLLAFVPLLRRPDKH
jgi:hypothetical protein